MTLSSAKILGSLLTVVLTGLERDVANYLLCLCIWHKSYDVISTGGSQTCQVWVHVGKEERAFVCEYKSTQSTYNLLTKLCKTYIRVKTTSSYHIRQALKTTSVCVKNRTSVCVNTFSTDQERCKLPLHRNTDFLHKTDIGNHRGYYLLVFARP